MTAEEDVTDRPKRRWLRRLLICLLALAILGLVINGPGARWFLAKTIRDKHEADQPQRISEHQ